MTNRQRIIDAIERKASQRLRDELAYFLDVLEESGEPRDIATAFDDARSFAESNGEQAISRECVNLMIEVGYYQPRTETAVILGRDRSPRRGGVRFDSVSAWACWVED
jgi:hypothetical protein